MLRYLLQEWLRQTATDAVHKAVARPGGKRPAKKKRAGEKDAPEPKELPPPPCQVGIVFALPIESGGLCDLLEDAVTTQSPTWTEHVGNFVKRRVAIVETGVGAEAAARATEDFLEVQPVPWIISAGFAGGLREGVRRGEIVMADTVLDLQGREFGVGLSMDPGVIAATRGLHVGRLATVGKIVASRREKRALGETRNAVAVDMETAAVAEVCSRRKVRFLSVRVISDTVDDELPPDIGALLKQKTLAGKLGAAAGAVWNRFSSVADMWQLREDAIKFSDRLARFLSGVVPQLVEESPSPRPPAPPATPP
jgi:adenosylhomocysteine nucleosidase